MEKENKDLKHYEIEEEKNYYFLKPISLILFFIVFISIFIGPSTLTIILNIIALILVLINTIIIFIKYKKDLFKDYEIRLHIFFRIIGIFFSILLITYSFIFIDACNKAKSCTCNENTCICKYNNNNYSCSKDILNKKQIIDE